MNNTNRYACIKVSIKNEQHYKDVKMNEIKKGRPAPDFKAKNYLNDNVNLKEFRGKKVLLSFHVFASCPFCNLRVNELKNKYPAWSAKGFEMIHVFPSPGNAIAHFAGKDNPPFPIVGDPEKKLYALYGLKKSTFGMLKGFLKLKRLFRAFKVVGLIDSLKNNDSDIRQLPADFLIDEKGIIREAFYAKTISDNLSIEKIEKFIGLGLKAA